MNTQSILLIEDDQLLREMYMECLASDTFSVTPARDGEEALQKLPERHWDLVLLDMMLPKINGYEILKRMQTEPDLKKYRKLVLMTNVEPDNEFNEAVKMADGYITKSEYDPDQFVKKITSFLAGA